MERMYLLREDLRGQGVRMLSATVVLIASALAVFDWSPPLLAAGAVAGTVGFGAWTYRRGVKTRLPSGPLPPAPLQASWAPRGRMLGEMANVLVMAATLGALIWLLGQEESALLGGALVVGRFAGTGVAALVGTRQVAEWERKHGLRVAFAGEDEDERRFAVHPLGLISRP